MPVCRSRDTDFSNFFVNPLDISSPLWYNEHVAGVSEWQTRQTQNLLSARACGFKSHYRHFKKSRDKETSMNQKDLSELKKHFVPADDLLVIRRVFSTFIDSEKTLRCRSVRSFAEIPQEEMSVLYTTLSRILKGKLGKALIEYEFPNEVYEEDQPQNLLWQLLENGLDDETQMEKYIAHLTEKLEYPLPYAVFIAQCTYTVFEKNKMARKTNMTAGNSTSSSVLSAPWSQEWMV